MIDAMGAAAVPGELGQAAAVAEEQQRLEAEAEELLLLAGGRADTHWPLCGNRQQKQVMPLWEATSVLTHRSLFLDGTANRSAVQGGTGSGPAAVKGVHQLGPGYWAAGRHGTNRRWVVMHAFNNVYLL